MNNTNNPTPSTPSTPGPATPRYVAPNAFSQRILNGAIKTAIRMGRAPAGGQLLEVRGRVSGKIQQVPVNPLQIGDTTYLVAPRGNTEWVRNLRQAETAELRTGRRSVTIKATEVQDEAKAPILRAYLKRWGKETGRFFEGATPASDDATFAGLAPGMPVFSITVRSQEATATTS